MKTKSFLILCILSMHLAAISQVKIGDNSTTVNSASLLELETTNKGFVLPRVSVTNVNSSAPLAAGLLTGTIIYNTNNGITGGSGTGIYYWDGSKWNFLANATTSGNYWSITGNSGLASSNFIGTTDAKDFVARTNNVERMRILGVASGSSQVGWIGMGVSAPKSALDVAGNYSGKNVFTIQNTSATGYSSVDMLDNSGNLAGTFGFANSGTGALFSGKDYFNIYGNDFVFTNNSGTYAFYVKGSNGYIGLNTNTPSERLHVVGNIYLNGAFMPAGDAGTSGYFLTSAGANTSPTWTNPNNIAWRLTGNSGTSASANFIGTSDAVDFVTRTNNTERLRITSAGNVGIGLTNPSYKLAVLAASNPLYLSGVQATSTFTEDSILTINAGVIKKTPYSSLTGNFWSITGNSGTSYATNFLGTTDDVSMRFRTNNTERMIIDSLGHVGIGSSSFNALNPGKLLVDYGATTSNTIVNLKGNTDNYFQINLQNQSSGANSSSDYVATASDGTDSTFYVDLGINGGGYVATEDNWGGPHDAYLYTYGKNLVIGSQTTNGDVLFLLGGGRSKYNAVLRLDGATKNLIVGTGENQTNATGNIIRGPNGGNGTNIPGGSLTLQGGSSNGNTAGGNLNLYGGGTVSGTRGSVNINASTNSATNINTGTSASDVIIGNALNNINLPKLSASSVVLTDAGKNLTSTTPSANTYLYYNGSNFTWATAATLSSFSVTAPLTYNNLTGVFGINQSGTSADGYLSTTDWNTFNNKVEDITLNTPSSLFNNPINFSVSAGTATGTLSLNTQTANTVFAGPSGGAAAAPGFRTLVAADIPSLSASYIQNQTTQQASSNFNISGTGTVGGLLTSKAGHTNTGAFTTSGGTTNINASSNFATNINTGTSNGTVTIGGTGNKILLPKFSTVGGIFYSSLATGQLSTTGSNMTWDSVNNRLGIGITSPGYKLSVLSGSDPLYLSGIQATATFTTDSVLTINAGIVKKTSYSSLTGNFWSLAGNSGATAGTNFIGTTDATDFVAKTNNVERLRILGTVSGSSQAGWIGMGITMPRSSLDVTGYYTNKNILTLQNTSASGYSSVDMLDSTGTLKGTFGYANNNTGNFSGKDYFNIYGNDFILTKSTSYDFYMKGSNGYIGLNTNTPSERLHVVGNFYLDGAFMPDGDAGTSGYVLTSAGANVPPAWTKSTNFAWGITGNKATTAGTNFIGTTDAIDLVTRTNDTERMRITSSGNVGIGTTSPQQSLSVSKGVNIDQSSANTGSTVNALTFGSSSGEGVGSKRSVGGNQYGLDFYTAFNNRMVITNAGNVGIGTTSPSYKLSVLSGSDPLYLSGVQSTATFTTDSVLTIYNGVVKKTPYSSLPSGMSGWSLTGNSGTIAGTNFLGTTDATALQFRYNNIAAGYLDASNTSFGTSASASNNAVAIGENATASQLNNTAVGNDAKANVSSQATAIGASSQALFQNNTAIGYNAQATVSNQETVIGASSQAQGQNNIAIGYSAKALNSDKITVVGSNAQASFQNNTVVGSSALATSNNQATAIGATAVAQAQNATALGYGASATGTNSTAIGSSATTSQNNALVLGTSTTNVGIATSTPNTTASLDVNAKFKLGDIGTVNKNVVSFASTLGSTFLSAGSFSASSFSASSFDVTITIPSVANYLTSTQATVTVSPNFDLPASVSIASARMISISQLKIRFVNASNTAQTISGQLYITINEF